MTNRNYFKSYFLKNVLFKFYAKKIILKNWILTGFRLSSHSHLNFRPKWKFLVLMWKLCSPSSLLLGRMTAFHPTHWIVFEPASSEDAILNLYAQYSSHENTGFYVFPMKKKKKRKIRCMHAKHIRYLEEILYHFCIFGFTINCKKKNATH